MKRVLVLGLGAVVGSAMSFSASANPTIYGKANVSLQSYDNIGYKEENSPRDADSWELNSNASRLGVKGKENLVDGLDAVYKLEYEVDIDGDDDVFKQRNIYVGLQSKYGTLIAGKFDTPLKVSQGKFDQFNDLELGDIKNTLIGDNRSNNIIMYSSPKMFNDLVKVNAAFIPGEENDVDFDENNPATNLTDRDVRDEIADSTSFSVELGDAKYKKHMFFASLAYDNEVRSEFRNLRANNINGASTNKKQFMDTLRGTAGIKLGALKLAAIAQTAESSDENANFDELEHDGYGVSAAYGIGKVTLKAQYLKAENEQDRNNGQAYFDEELDQFSFGADYKLNKRTKAFAYYSKVESDLKVKEGADIDDEEDKDTFGVGLEVKFGQ